jgi:surfactin synthase thioesterase subunit
MERAQQLAVMPISLAGSWMDREPRPAARVRLFCLPYAGGGVSAYRAWQPHLPAEIDLCPIQLPGRERRYRERLCTSLTPLVSSLATALAPHVGQPYALFGHSMGALVAFELARELRRRGAPAPVRLFVSALKPPQDLSARPRDRHRLDDDALLDDIRRFGGTPASLLEDGEVMRLVLPILRADFAMLETHRHYDESPLDTPIAAFAGTHDPEAPPAAMDGWRAQTSAPFRLSVMPGDHFFLQARAARQALVDAVTRDLFEALTQAA